MNSWLACGPGRGRGGVLQVILAVQKQTGRGGMVSMLSKCLRERSVETKDSCLGVRRQTHRLDELEGGGKEDSPEKVT